MYDRLREKAKLLSSLGLYAHDQFPIRIRRALGWGRRKIRKDWVCKANAGIIGMLTSHLYCRTIANIVHVFIVPDRIPANNLSDEIESRL